MHPEIENLINMALVAGEVTEKKRAIILRKAESLGLDKDEVEMILEGKIALNLKEKNASQPHLKPESNKSGDIKKCPSCGASVQAFTTKCPDCGYEFRNIDSANSVNNLISKLEEAEEKIRNTNSESGGGIVAAWMKLMEGGEENSLEKRIFNAKSSIVSSFPVPNTKEDILEFLALSVAQVNSIKIGRMDKFAGTSGIFGYRITYKNAWLSIANKVVIKARFSMKEDKKTLEEIEYYAKQLKIK